MGQGSDFTEDWAALNHPPKDNGCHVCGSTGPSTEGRVDRNQGGPSAVISSRWPVEWRCAGCHRPVCRECTLCIPTARHLGPIRARDGGREYYSDTLCSIECWERRGRPEE